MSVIQWVADQNVDITTTDPSTGFCILHAACKGGHSELLRALLEWDLQVATVEGPAELRNSMHRPLDGQPPCRCDILMITRVSDTNWHNRAAKHTGCCSDTAVSKHISLLK